MYLLILLWSSMGSLLVDFFFSLLLIKLCHYKRFNHRLPMGAFLFMALRIAYICIEVVIGPVCFYALPIHELEYYQYLIHFPEMDNPPNPFAEAAGQGWGENPEQGDEAPQPPADVPQPPADGPRPPADVVEMGDHKEI